MSTIGQYLAEQVSINPQRFGYLLNILIPERLKLSSKDLKNLKRIDSIKYKVYKDFLLRKQKALEEFTNSIYNGIYPTK